MRLLLHRPVHSTTSRAPLLRATCPEIFKHRHDFALALRQLGQQRLVRPAIPFHGRDLRHSRAPPAAPDPPSAASWAIVIHANISRDGVQPGKDRFARPVSMPDLMDSEPRFLEQIVGEPAADELDHEKPVQRRTQPRHQIGRRARIALAGSRTISVSSSTSAGMGEKNSPNYH